MTARTLTGQLKVWLTPYDSAITPDKLSDPAVLKQLTFNAYDMRSQGWTQIGSADVTVRLLADREIFGNRIESLRAEKAKTLADARAKATDLEREIQTLLAIAYDDGSAPR